MSRGLNANERRALIVDFLERNKKTTRKELSAEFGVTIMTIARDISILSKTVPIYTKAGKDGGIYIMPDYHSKKNYLTDEEANLLKSLSKKLSDEEMQIINGIISRFSKKAVLGI